MKRLHPGDPFPTVSGSTVGGGSLTLPADLSTPYGIVLTYRAHWWPFCDQQLADYQANLDEATAKGISVYAISTDPLDKAQETVNKLGLTFPVLYGVNGPATAETLACWYEEKRNIIQPAAFIIDPERNILNVTYTSGPIGRLQVKDALGLVGFYASKKISATTVDKEKGWTANVTGA